MALNHKGKTALISGTNKGIGLEVARSLHKCLVLLPARPSNVAALDGLSNGVDLFSRLRTGMIFIQPLGRYYKGHYGHEVKNNFGN